MFVPLQLNQGNFNRFAGGSGSTSPYVVANLAALKALTTRPLFVEMLASITVGDGLGGSYYWVAGDTSTADDITVVTPTSGTAGRYKLWGFRSSTLSPYPTTSTNPGTAKSIDSLQYAAGTVTAPTSLNKFKIFSDATIATNGSGTDYFVEGFTHEHYFGGSGVTGGRQGLTSYLYLTAATASTNDNRNYVALAGIATANDDDGGSGTAAGTSKGQFFGGGFVGVAANGAVNLNNVTGAEFNTAMQTGSSVYAKSIAQFSGRTDDVVKGSGVDAMLWLYKQNTAATTWTNGILFDYPASANFFPFDTNSTVIETGAGTIGIGVDFSASTVTTSAFKSPGFDVSGAGAITSTVGTITTSQPGIAIGQTWNNVATIFQGIVVNLTNTNSAANSRVMDFVVGGASAFSVDPLGQIRGTNFIATAGNFFQWNGRSLIKSTSDGVISVFASNGTTFSTFNCGAVTSSANINTTAGTINYLGVTTGAADTMAITASPAITALTTGAIFFVKANAANATTTPTININSLGAKTLVKRQATALAANDYLANMFILLLYDGTNMVLLNPVVN